MNNTLQTFQSYSAIENWRTVYKKRLDTALTLQLQENSPYYPAFREIQFRYQRLEETCRFIEESAALPYPTIVEKWSIYLAELFGKISPIQSNDPETFEKAAVSKAYEDALNSYCDSMNVFSNYKITDHDIILADALNMLLHGVDFWITYREQICRVNKS